MCKVVVVYSSTGKSVIVRLPKTHADLNAYLNRLSKFQFNHEIGVQNPNNDELSVSDICFPPEIKAYNKENDTYTIGWKGWTKSFDEFWSREKVEQEVPDLLAEYKKKEHHKLTDSSLNIASENSEETEESLGDDEIQQEEEEDTEDTEDEEGKDREDEEGGDEEDEEGEDAEDEEGGEDEEDGLGQ
jgi:hypothetical protein